MKGATRLLCALAATLACAPAAAAPEASGEARVALVIGNASYRDSPLLNPVNDAKAVSSALRQAGFEVIERHDLGATEMRRAIREFGEKLRGKGAGLFYFAGHGVQVNGRNFLIPANADIKYEDEIEDQSIDASLVLGKMESAKARINIVILDACRNNPFARGSRSAQSGLAAMEAPIGSLIAYATSPGQVASDGAGANGLYTQHLVREIGRPGLKVEDVFKRVRAAVRQASNGRQVPWENTSLEGDFYFRAPDRTEPVVSVQEARRQREAEVQRAVAEALTRSQEEAERERKRLEAAFAEKLEAERAAIRRDALERIAAAEKAARQAIERPAPDKPAPQAPEAVKAASVSRREPAVSTGAGKDPSPPPVNAPSAAAAAINVPAAAPRERPDAAVAATDPSPPPANTTASGTEPQAHSAATPPEPAAPTPADPTMVALADIAPDSRSRPVADAIARGQAPATPRVGDFWLYHREIRDGEGVTRRNYVTLTVERTGVEGYQVSSSMASAPYRYDAAGNLLSMPNATGAGVVVFDPAEPALRFPLEPGRSWSAQYRERTPAFEVQAESTTNVAGWESVQVEAGRFDAIRVNTVADRMWEPFPGQQTVSKRVTSLWYVPALGRFARLEVLEVTNAGVVVLDQVWELDSFRLP